MMWYDFMGIKTGCGGKDEGRRKKEEVAGSLEVPS